MFLAQGKGSEVPCGRWLDLDMAFVNGIYSSTNDTYRTCVKRAERIYNHLYPAQ